MKLVTFQSFDAFKDFIQKGYLECDEKYIDIEKNGTTDQWVLEKMNQQIENKYNTKYPLWCWVKCHHHICPSRHKGEPVQGFDVKITFHKEKKDIFITDFRRYSFLLNNTYIPYSLKDKEQFDQKRAKYHITNNDLKAYVRKDKFASHRIDSDFLQICKEIRNSFDRCITTDSDILQGCVWRINLEDIEAVEFLTDKNYRYGSLNYIRKNGKRMDWQADFYKKLK